MLVLSRKQGEQIVIVADGREIVLTVVEFRSYGKVRLGIEADKDVIINRKEIHKAPSQGRG